MISSVGSCPCMKAGKATDADIDFADLGGIVMMRRLIWPNLTCSSFQAIASMCQLGRYLVPGLSVPKHFAMNHFSCVRSFSFRSSSGFLRIMSCISTLKVGLCVIGVFLLLVQVKAQGFDSMFNTFVWCGRLQWWAQLSHHLLK